MDGEEHVHVRTDRSTKLQTTVMLVDLCLALVVTRVLAIDMMDRGRIMVLFVQLRKNLRTR